MQRVKKFIENVGWPRILIALFLLSLFVIAPFVGVRLDASINDTLVRFGMNGVLVLAMVPMVQSGCGLNFGLPLGIIAGLLGAVTSVELEVTGLAGVLTAMLIATPIAVFLGWCYGLLLNKVKGSEMMIATYVGFSSVAFMCIMWLALPYSSPNMVWGYAGRGLRTTISVEAFWQNAISRFATGGMPRISIKAEDPRIAAELIRFMHLPDLSKSCCLSASRFSSTKMQIKSLSI